MEGAGLIPVFHLYVAYELKLSVLFSLKDFIQQRGVNLSTTDVKYFFHLVIDWIR